MKLRKLNGNDIFKMSRILKKIDFKLDMGQLNDSTDTEKMQIGVGIDMIKNILENLHLAQDEVNEFLGDLVGCSGEEFGNKDLDEVAQVIVEFKEMVKESNFFTLVGKLM